MRLLPSRAAIAAALAAVLAAFFAWLRRDARRDLENDIQRKDMDHAQEIEDRVHRALADPERLRDFNDAGYRD